MAEGQPQDDDHTHGGAARDHGGAEHSHLPRDERKLAIAAALTGGFMVAEAVGGVLSGSLALLADAGHMLTDFASLVLAWLAMRLMRRPADWKRTYGFDRFSVLAAFVNGLALFAIAAWITLEAIQRLNEPQPVLGGLMLWIALAGLAVNLIAFRVISHGGADNLNTRAALLHVVGDLAGSVAAIVASLVILGTGWTPIDPILSVFVSVIILKSAWGVVRESGQILLETAPPGFDAREVARVLVEAVPGVAGVAHVHAWSITKERPMVTLEATLRPGADPDAARENLKQVLKDRFGMGHSTVEIAASGPLQTRLATD